MHWISHRGNLYGRQSDRENDPTYIDEALQAGFDVEVDIWYVDGTLSLGHDAPEHPITLDWLLARCEKLWCHAKNAAALDHLISQSNNMHVFSHDTDPVVLTSKGVPWVYPGHLLFPRSICVMPERAKAAYTEQQLRSCAGICSDYIAYYKQRHYAHERIGVLISGRLNCHHENLIPQIHNFLTENPQMWMDVHIALNDDHAQTQRYLQQHHMDAPYFATLTCSPFVVPPHYVNHPRKRVETVAQNAVSMFLKNKEAFAQMENYARDNGTSYSCVIKYRPDIVHGQQRFPQIIQNMQSGAIYIPYINQYSGVNDQIAMGLLNDMRVYCDVYPHIDHHINSDPNYEIHPETMLWYHLYKNNMRSITFDYDYTLDNRRKAQH